MKKFAIMLLSLVLLLSATLAIAAGCGPAGEGGASASPSTSTSPTPSESPLPSPATPAEHREAAIGALMQGGLQLISSNINADLTVALKDAAGKSAGSVALNLKLKKIDNFMDLVELKNLQAAISGNVTYPMGEQEAVVSVAASYQDQTAYVKVASGENVDVKIKATASGIEELIGFITSLIPNQPAQAAQAFAAAGDGLDLDAILSMIVAGTFNVENNKIVSSLTITSSEATETAPAQTVTLTMTLSKSYVLEKVVLSQIDTGAGTIDVAVDFDASGYTEVTAPSAQEAATYADLTALTSAAKTVYNMDYFKIAGTLTGGLAFGGPVMDMEAVKYDIQVQKQGTQFQGLYMTAKEGLNGDSSTWFDAAESMFYIDYVGIPDGAIDTTKYKVSLAEALADYENTVLYTLNSSVVGLLVLAGGGMMGEGLPTIGSANVKIYAKENGVFTLELVLNMEIGTGEDAQATTVSVKADIATETQADGTVLLKGIAMDILMGMSGMGLGLKLDFSLDNTATLPEGGVLAGLNKNDFTTRQEQLDAMIEAIEVPTVANYVAVITRITQIQAAYDLSPAIVQMRVTKLDLMSQRMAECAVILDAQIAAIAAPTESTYATVMAQLEIVYDAQYMAVDELLASMTNLPLLEQRLTECGAMIDAKIAALPAVADITEANYAEVKTQALAAQAEFDSAFYAVQRKVTKKSLLKEILDACAAFETPAPAALAA